MKIKRISLIFMAIVILICSSACSSEKNDTAFLTNMQKGLEARWKLSNKMDETMYANSADYREDLLACINAELDKLGTFESYEFSDSALANLANEYFTALNTQLDGYKYFGVDDIKYEELFTQSYYERADIIYQLCENYSFSVSNTYASTLADMTVVGEVYHDIKAAVLAIEEQVSVLSLERVGTDEYTFTLTNTSELNFEYAELIINGYNSSGATTASGTEYLSDWHSGSTVNGSIRIGGEFDTATAQVVLNYNYQEYTFNPIEIEVSDDLVLYVNTPSTPISVSYSSGNKETTRCQITNISYEVGDWYDGEATLYIYISGEKTYDKSGNYYSRDCQIGWKLYDHSGAVIDSGTCYSGDCKVGEQFKNAKISVFDLPPGNYSLKILDVK